MSKDEMIAAMLASGRISVSAEGHVFSPLANKPEWPLGTITPKGYLRISLSIDGKLCSFMAHRIVAIAFHGMPPSPAFKANHIDTVKANNRPTNLEWTTNQGNAVHAGKHGLLGKARGHRQWKAKLRDQDVLAIRRRRSAGESRDKLADEFGISPTHLRRIVKGDSWTHLELANRD